MITTSCKGCVFATYTDEQQSGCQLGRADKLTYETDENSFLLKENIGSFLKNLN